MDTRLNQIEFIPEKHEYWFTENNKHIQLHGVTGAIGKLLGKNFPDTALVQVATIYGHDVHSESELWIKEGREPSTEAGKWLISFLKDFQEKNKVTHYKTELLCSDFIGTASCIDIVAFHKDRTVTLFDIKTTSEFHREYCSLQLSVYKRLFEACYDQNVNAMFVLGTKAKRSFRIIQQDDSKIRKILNMNKEI